MKMENPRRGGNPAGAVVKVIQQNDNNAPPSKFQPRNESARSDARALEAAVARDKAFFARHPFLRTYRRELMPDEFPPSLIPVPQGCKLQELVEVRRIGANLRTRTVLMAIIAREGE